MAYATIENILSQVSPEAPPDPSLFPDFDPQDMKAWAYFIHVYLDCTSRGEGRPSFMPRYFSDAGTVRWDAWDEIRDPFYKPYGHEFDASIKGSYIKILLDYIKKLTEQWYNAPKDSLQILGFKVTPKNYPALYSRAMEARDVAWRKIMAYSAALIGVQDSANSRIILPEIAVLYGKVKYAWDSVFGNVASIRITSSYRTPREQDLVATTRKNPETTHATGGAIDVQPDWGNILFPWVDKRFVFWAYLVWLFRVTGQATFGKKPYTILEKDNNVVHVSYTYLLNEMANSQYVTPELVRPYRGDLPHESKTSAKLLKEDLGPNAITDYWEVFNANTFSLESLESDVARLDPNGAVSAAWMSGFLNYLREHGIEQDKVSRVNITSLGSQYGDP